MRTAEEIITAVNLELITEMDLDISEYTIIHKDKMSNEQRLMYDFTIRCINIARKELIDEITDNPYENGSAEHYLWGDGYYNAGEGHELFMRQQSLLDELI